MMTIAKRQPKWTVILAQQQVTMATAWIQESDRQTQAESPTRGPVRKRMRAVDMFADSDQSEL